VDARKPSDHGRGLVEPGVDAPGARLGRELDELRDEAAKQRIEAAPLDDIGDERVEPSEVFDRLVGSRWLAGRPAGHASLRETETVGRRREESVGDLLVRVGVERPAEILLHPVENEPLLFREPFFDLAEVPPVDEDAGGLHLHQDAADVDVDPPVDPLQLSHRLPEEGLGGRDESAGFWGWRLLTQTGERAVVMPEGPVAVVHAVDGEWLGVQERQRRDLLHCLGEGRHLVAGLGEDALLQTVDAPPFIRNEVREHRVGLDAVDVDRLVGPILVVEERRIELGVVGDGDDLRGLRPDGSKRVHRRFLIHLLAEVEKLRERAVGRRRPVTEKRVRSEGEPRAHRGGALRRRNVERDAGDARLTQVEIGGL